MPIKIALPKGRLLSQTSALLQRADWQLDEYHEKARRYHLKSEKHPSLVGKVLHEKDIPIQVAVGNYDLGICSLDWIEELLVKYPSSALVKVKGLGYGEGALFITISPSAGLFSVEQLKAREGLIRIASEYPNLAENFALRNRLARFSIFPVWGGAEAYPPENAELALISGKTEAEIRVSGMFVIDSVLDYSAFLIANRDSWESRDLGEVVASVCDKLPVERRHAPTAVGESVEIPAQHLFEKMSDDVVRLALPDGHQQVRTVNLLKKAGIQIEDYPSPTGNRRPKIKLDGVMVKVIRPQDMPLQVANGNFDLAITGKDWLAEHLYQFPSSPVRELLNLKYGKVRIVAVVSQSLSVNSGRDLHELNATQTMPIRIASEYVNIADRYARDNRLAAYRIIPTWGATEAFLPDDADLLIENTETGSTIARHNLKIIDTLFESTACLISNTKSARSPAKKQKMRYIIEALEGAAEGS